MRIAVLGATGRTGRHIVEQAIAADHTVTAVVRQTGRLPHTSKRLHETRADVFDPDSLRPALAGHDAVLSALGLTGVLAGLRPTTFYSRSAHAIITAMRRQRVQRFIGLTSQGVADDPTAPLPYRVLLKPLLRHKYSDMAVMEHRFQTSGLDWTIIRPARLTDGSRTGGYRLGRNGVLTNSTHISRTDLAEFMLSHLHDQSLFQRAVAIST